MPLEATHDRAPVIIIGAGIGGLTLALSLHQRGIPCRVFEATEVLQPLGVGINLLPHAMREMTALGLQEQLLDAGVECRENVFYNRHGQHIHSEPRGRHAGHRWPQVSLHRGALQQVLLDAARERLGEGAVRTGCRFLEAHQGALGVTAHFATDAGELEIPGSVAVGCDGIRSTLRRQIHRGADPLVYAGITMWRGITRWPPFLTGATMAYAGALETGKFIAYPIGHRLDDEGRQPINWLCELTVPARDPSGDWSRRGALEDFIAPFDAMTLPWLDVGAFVRAADFVLEYPMVDRDPIPTWTEGRLTLLGDAAHPMTPRGSNGAGQAILDARTLAHLLDSHDDAPAALAAYEAARRPATAEVVRANRAIPPDAILGLVHQRTGGQPFERIEDVVAAGELEALSHRYQRIAGFDRGSLAAGNDQGQA